MENPTKPTEPGLSAGHPTAAGVALRERAEGLARRRFPLPPMSLEALSPEAMRQTLHDLQVHQIELEMQNEELQRAQIQLDKAKSRYFDLYDMMKNYVGSDDPDKMGAAGGGENINVFPVKKVSIPVDTNFAFPYRSLARCWQRKPPTDSRSSCRQR